MNKLILIILLLFVLNPNFLKADTKKYYTTNEKLFIFKNKELIKKTQPIGAIMPQEVVKVIDVSNGYAYIEYEKGKYGWAEYNKLVPAEENNKLKIMEIISVWKDDKYIDPFMIFGDYSEENDKKIVNHLDRPFIKKDILININITTFNKEVALYHKFREKYKIGQ